MDIFIAQQDPWDRGDTGPSIVTLSLRGKGARGEAIPLERRKGVDPFNVMKVKMGDTVITKKGAAMKTEEEKVLGEEIPRSKCKVRCRECQKQKESSRKQT